ncbi:hypothetical protein ACVWZA_003817 [Sphingomonas sp. UYAg733]
MAKKDKAAKAAKAGGAAKAAKLPKRIAGIKVPRELRKSGAALLEKANSPIGREVIAAGITAIVAAAARSQAGRKVTAKATETASNAAQTGVDDVRQIADAISVAASAVMQRLFEKKAG